MKPHVSIIVARSNKGVIGYKGKLPWHFPEDLKFFKQTTLGRPVLMGRKTWESIGRPLPGRRNIVLTSKPGYKAEGAEVLPSFLDALKLFDAGSTLMVIGGASVYEQCLPYADTAWVTEIDGDFEGDTFFEELNPDEWKRVWVEEHPAGENRPWRFRFQRFERIRNQTF